MTRKTALAALKDILKWAEEDREMAHHNADDVLITLLISLGYQDVARAWSKIPKWYA